MSNALGAYHDGTGSDPGRVTCFCEFCVAKGKRQGIDVERVKAGFRELEQYVKAGRAGQRPIDGYYVTFWRILLRNPRSSSGRSCGPKALTIFTVASSEPSSR